MKRCHTTTQNTCHICCSLPNLRLRATTAKRRRPPNSRATGPLTLGGKSPIVGPRLKGGGLLAAAYATGGSAACKPKGEQQPRHPEVRGTATAVATPHLVLLFYFSLRVVGPVAELDSRAPRSELA
uniref:Uncharacterized protein n=1 Tax=Hyaloperonospora arabidopsidis (strain Emoy2) TaxID=559515 RepID=M4BAI6_HYAAE